jgi:hypothetical protein
VLASVLRERYGGEALVYAPECYRNTRTYDGVCVCAERVLTELRVLAAAHPSLRAVSLLGYSFGGLVRSQQRAAQRRAPSQHGAMTPPRCLGVRRLLATSPGRSLSRRPPSWAYSR